MYGKPRVPAANAAGTGLPQTTALVGGREAVEESRAACLNQIRLAAALACVGGVPGGVSPTGSIVMTEHCPR